MNVKKMCVVLVFALALTLNRSLVCSPAKVLGTAKESIPPFSALLRIWDSLTNSRNAR